MQEVKRTGSLPLGKANAMTPLCIFNTKRIIILHMNVADYRYSRGSSFRGA